MKIVSSSTNHRLLLLILFCIVYLIQQQPLQYCIVNGFSVIGGTSSSRQCQHQIASFCRRTNTKLTAKVVVSSLFSVKTTIEICQNKHCCKNWKGKLSLPEIISDLLSVPSDSTAGSSFDAINKSIEIVTVSCLSQCEKGPNIRLNGKDVNDQLVFGVVDVTTASIVLESLFSSSASSTISDSNHYNSSTISSKLVAGINCIEKSIQVSNVDEKIRYLTSVIRALTNDDILKYTSTNARAHVLRGELYMEQCLLKKNVQQSEQEQEMIQFALQDINDALIILQYLTDTANTDSKSNTLLLSNSNILFSPLYGQAYRIQAEIYVHQQQYNNALESLTNASIVNPLMKSKYSTEMNRIVQLQL